MGMLDQTWISTNTLKILEGFEKMSSSFVEVPFASSPNSWRPTVRGKGSKSGLTGQKLSENFDDSSPKRPSKKPSKTGNTGTNGRHANPAGESRKTQREKYQIETNADEPQHWASLPLIDDDQPKRRHGAVWNKFVSCFSEMQSCGHLGREWSLVEVASL
jgi:hypothetical protein